MITNNINILWASVLIEELVRQGVNYFCISPGSRSTPLTAAAAMNPAAEKIVCLDERAAAFHAVAYAKASGQPAAVICTSGTAVANYLPAAVEADADFVPLIVISADRPPELSDAGANQAISQKEIFNPYVRWKTDLPCPNEEIPLNYIMTTAAQAYYRSVNRPAGPVHINCMFREPLAPDTKKIGDEYIQQFMDITGRKGKFTDYKLCGSKLHCTDNGDILNTLSSAKKGLIIVGSLKSDSEKEAVQALAAKLDWPVFADILSGLRSMKNSVHYYDRIINNSNCEAHYPDAILHIGGKFTSKALQGFIESARPKNYIAVSSHPRRFDPGHVISHKIETDIADFCHQTASVIKSQCEDDFKKFWSDSNDISRTIIKKFIRDQREPNEINLISNLSEMMPRHMGLFLAGSMPVRDADMFIHPEAKTNNIAGNRGASGIDGVIASACGYAAGLKEPVTLLCGDISFIHDMNSLSLIEKSKQQVIIVVVNNQGGGIFSFLPVANHEFFFEEYFGTPHNYDFESAAKTFNIEYMQSYSLDNFRAAYQNALESGTSLVMEINTCRKENILLHKQFDGIIYEALLK